MRKPDSLRAHLTAALPELQREPDALTIYVTGGTIAARIGASLGFEYRYKAEIVLLNYRGDPGQIFLPLLVWIGENQIELLLNHQAGVSDIGFEVDPIDNQAVDVQITLPLSEAVDVQPGGDGGYAIAPRPEPAIPGTEPLSEQLALLREIYAPGGSAKELLVPQQET